MPSQLISLAGIAVILGIAFALSTARRRIRLRVVGAAFALQALMALLVLIATALSLAAFGLGFTMMGGEESGGG